MKIKVIRRQVILRRTPPDLESEFGAARWVQNRLIDTEMEHQEVMNQCAPELTRVGRILSRLARRDRWREHGGPGGWRPKPKPALRAALEARKKVLRDERNASEEWRRAKHWPNVILAPKVCRRKAGESDEVLAARQAKAGRTRREVRELEVYRDRRCYWATFNAAKDAVAQAVKTVIKTRATGMPASIRRPSWHDSGRIVAQASLGGFEMLEYGRRRIRCRMRLFAPDAWIELQTSGRGDLPALPEGATIREVELCREHRGATYRYHLCLTVRADWPEPQGGDGIVGIDSGHRRILNDGSLRVAAWHGNDGKCGEIRLPARCDKMVSESYRIQSRLDTWFLEHIVSGIGDRRAARNRQRYRRYLARLGVRTRAQHEWLRRELRDELRALALRRQARDLRDEVYRRAARDLRSRYSRMAIDTAGKEVQQLQISEETRRVIRRHRDLAAAYSLQTRCEQLGIELLAVSARGSTGVCPHCGHRDEIGEEMVHVCSACGHEYDRDYASAREMCARAIGAARTAQKKVAE